jgi:hypothetical protein
MTQEQKDKLKDVFVKHSARKSDESVKHSVDMANLKDLQLKINKYLSKTIHPLLTEFGKEMKGTGFKADISPAYDDSQWLCGFRFAIINEFHPLEPNKTPYLALGQKSPGDKNLFLLINTSTDIYNREQQLADKTQCITYPFPDIDIDKLTADITNGISKILADY